MKPQIKNLPDRYGHFEEFGGRYVPETLIFPLWELERHYLRLKRDSGFKRELAGYLKDYAGRPTPLYFARNLTERMKGAKLFLKREDLCHTGAHKINNTIGQGLLALRMNKRRVIAETGAGQHGVATATAACLLGLKAEIFMGTEDIRRQALNVTKMKLLGAVIHEVQSGSKTLKDATNEAIRDWVARVDDTHYLLGSTVGPHPYPMIVRDFQSVIGREARRQCFAIEGRLPDLLVACVGGGSNSLGLFYPFLRDPVRMLGVEAAGLGLSTGRHAASVTQGEVGVLHGMKSLVLEDEEGQINLAHSISAGLDYPSVGPEHAYLKKTGRVEYCAVNDREALRAFHLLTEEEGILPALESAHAISEACLRAKRMKRSEIVVVCLSGRGDKDISIVQEKNC